MKCNQCGTTIPEGSKKCNGCGKKVTMFTKFQQSYNEESNNQIKELEEIPEEKYELNENESNEDILNENESNEDILNENSEKDQLRPKVTIEGIEIKEKPSIIAIILSFIGMMFLPYGIILNIIASKIVQRVKNQEEQEIIEFIIKFFFVISLIGILGIFLLK